MTMLEKVKKAVRQTGAGFESELEDLIAECKADLQSIGVEPDDSRPLIQKAIKLYCRVNFGEPDDYDRLKTAYDEIRAQLQSCRDYQDGGA